MQYDPRHLAATRTTPQVSATWQSIRMFSVALCLVCLNLSNTFADWKDDIGYTQLWSMVGSSLPNGNGVPISIVEAGSGTPSKYFPDTTNDDFQADDDPLTSSVNFIDGSGMQSNGISNHATNSVSRPFIGNTSSVAPGANEVTVYEANHYLSSILRATGGAAPVSQPYRVQNFSWIGSYENDSHDTSALRRFDFVIERDNITAMVGLNNGITSMPRLFAQSYNSIAVGRSDGQHSTGLTDFSNYGPGRSKPDIVAPRGTTSASTATMSSVATFLHSAVAGTDAAKSETMKAILMAGAIKDSPHFTSTWTHTPTQPLDDIFGAGEVNAYNSYLITQGGRFTGDAEVPTPVASHGWDYQTITGGSGNELEYLFSVPVGSTATELSILLDWNIDIPSGFNSQTLANFSLDLKDSSGQSIQTSNSAVDNVEHLYLTNLGPGEYTLSVASNMTHDFGLAWRTSTLFDFASADFDDDGDVDGRDFLTWQRGYGKLLGAAHSEGDADGDGDVDADDIMVFHAQYGSPPELASALIFAVPEPSTLVLVTGGLFAFLLRRRR
ncbi:PEP-CTERM sorting domain-containing protein [Bythopirellula goksoeyrii]|uniref:Ice-binding protein C-terminal domain-containing protein n=1 Tax=Bythopirellula goksoeyrii TaxID=1400387 RepID=A0A5B9Q748_9BACT|nr:PEP-CTERM sorting domain-containing protein [Bythopirellula goksoeyrii]QEG33540.1 hypothetical protein Pr1d_08040 [Bythopirellula goksoeyrii]